MVQAGVEGAESVGQPTGRVNTPTRSGGRREVTGERVTVWHHQMDTDGAAPPTASVIPNGMTVVGDCRATGDVFVDGEVRGSVSVAGLLVIGRDGLVEGSVVARDAVVAGSVSGVVIVEASLDLTDTAQVFADVQAGCLLMEDGAELVGSVQIGRHGLPRGSSDSIAPEHPPAPPTYLSDADTSAEEYVRLHFRVH